MPVELTGLGVATAAARRIGRVLEVGVEDLGEVDSGEGAALVWRDCRPNPMRDFSKEGREDVGGTAAAMMWRGRRGGDRAHGGDGGLLDSSAVEGDEEEGASLDDEASSFVGGETSSAISGAKYGAVGGRGSRSVGVEEPSLSPPRLACGFVGVGPSPLLIEGSSTIVCSAGLYLRSLRPRLNVG